jgi:peptidoglycan hydrolase-like protein with peptidoglycan-binding domain
MWAKATHRPVDSVAIFAAAAASVIIVVNAAYLQSGSHPAPFFANTRTSQVAADSRPKPVEPAAPARPAAAMPVPQPAAVRRNDPIADLIGPSPRITAVQRALSEYGYGQIKPSGFLDDATSAAIEKFERERKLPVTGRITDRLLTGLTSMVGHPLE